MYDDSPRNYSSARDERFSTPRLIARSISSNNSSTNEDYTTPRGISLGQDSMSARSFYTDNSSRSNESVYGENFQSARSYRENDFQTARSYNNDSARSFYDTIPPTFSRQGTNSSINYKDYKDDTKSNYTDFNEEHLEIAFRYARNGRQDELVEYLTNNNIDPDLYDSFGNTLLITGCQNGNKKIVKSMLRLGANINAKNFKGNTALHYCYHCK